MEHITAVSAELILFPSTHGTGPYLIYCRQEKSSQIVRSIVVFKESLDELLSILNSTDDEARFIKGNEPQRVKSNAQRASRHRVQRITPVEVEYGFFWTWRNRLSEAFAKGQECYLSPPAPAEISIVVWSSENIWMSEPTRLSLKPSLRVNEVMVMIEEVSAQKVVAEMGKF